MKKNAFTLVELLISVTIIGILAGIGVSVINPVLQRNRAEDAVRLANLEKVAQAVRSYCVAESACPTASDFTTSTSTFRTYYATLSDTDAALFTYSVSGSSFEVRIPFKTTSTPQKYYKYRSSVDKIDECTSTTFGGC